MTLYWGGTVLFVELLDCGGLSGQCDRTAPIEGLDSATLESADERVSVEVGLHTKETPEGRESPLVQVMVNENIEKTFQYRLCLKGDKGNVTVVNGVSQVPKAEKMFLHVSDQ